MGGGSSSCLAAPRHSATSYTRLYASDRLVPLRSFSFQTRHAIFATSASARAVICPHQGRAFRCHPRRAAVLQHLRTRVPTRSSTASPAPKLTQTAPLRAAGPCAGARRRSLRATSAPPPVATLSGPRSAHTGAMPSAAARRFSAALLLQARHARPPRAVPAPPTRSNAAQAAAARRSGSHAPVPLPCGSVPSRSSTRTARLRHQLLRPEPQPPAARPRSAPPEPRASAPALSAA
jgi:hypothetical protein